MLRHLQVHSCRGKTQSLRSKITDATEATYSYNKRRRHFPVLVSSNTLGTEIRSHRCLVAALGGMLCVMCEAAPAWPCLWRQRSKPKFENCAAKNIVKSNGFTFFSKSSTIWCHEVSKRRNLLCSKFQHFFSVTLSSQWFEFYGCNTEWMLVWQPTQLVNNRSSSSCTTTTR